MKMDIPLVSTSKEEKHESLAEPTVLLYLIVVHVARLFSHAKKHHKRWLDVIENRLIPPVAEYARHVEAVRGTAETKKLMGSLLKDSLKVLENGIEHACNIRGVTVVADKNDLKKHKGLPEALGKYSSDVVDSLLDGSESTEAVAKRITADLYEIVKAETRAVKQ